MHISLLSPIILWPTRKLKVQLILAIYVVAFDTVFIYLNIFFFPTLFAKVASVATTALALAVETVAMIVAVRNLKKDKFVESIVNQTYLTLIVPYRALCPLPARIAPTRPLFIFPIAWAEDGTGACDQRSYYDN